MARLNAPCPFCTPDVQPAREEWEDMTQTQRKNWAATICDRCWHAILGAAFEEPVNEAEQLDGAR